MVCDAIYDGRDGNGGVLVVVVETELLGAELFWNCCRINNWGKKGIGELIDRMSKIGSENARCDDGIVYAPCLLTFSSSSFASIRQFCDVIFEKVVHVVHPTKIDKIMTVNTMSSM